MCSWGYKCMKQMLIDGTPTIKYGFMPSKRPTEGVPNPQYVQSEQVLGRDGAFYRFEGTFDDIVQTIEFSFVANDGEWHEQFRKIKRFLLKGGIRKYTHEDNPHWFKFIKKIVLKTPERVALRSGTFECEFTFAPYEYRVDGQNIQSISECEFNKYSKCYPVFKVYRKTVPLEDGNTFDITVNGNTLTFTCPDYATIDTRLGLVYRDKNQMLNTAGCSIGELALEEGPNEITVTDIYSVNVIPNWRAI